MLLLEPLRKYARFSGRARRGEFWLFMLCVWILTLVLTRLAYPMHMNIVATDTVFMLRSTESTNSFWVTVLGLFLLAAFLPTLAVAIRRLHDIDRSGWWWLLSLTGIGNIILFIFYLLDGTRGPNRFGADPKGRPTPSP